jgi:hypothetical protein
MISLQSSSEFSESFCEGEGDLNLNMLLVLCRGCQACLLVSNKPNAPTGAAGLV